MMCLILISALICVAVLPTSLALHFSNPDHVIVSDPSLHFGLHRRLPQGTPENLPIAGPSSSYPSSSPSDRRLRAFFRSPMLAGSVSQTQSSRLTFPNFIQRSRDQTLNDDRQNFHQPQTLSSTENQRPNTSAQTRTDITPWPVPVQTEPSTRDQMLSFMKILNERRSVIASDRHTQLIKFYLSELNKIKAVEPSMGKAFVLEMQIDFIGNIADTLIKREVLKIFIKDMVEKSGFLSGGQTAPTDIEALTSLIDSIGDITQRLSPSSVQNAPTNINYNNNNNAINQLTPESVEADASRRRLEGVFSNVNAVIENAQHDVTGDVIFGTNSLTAFNGLSPVSSRGLTIFGEVPAVETVPPTRILAFQEEILGGSGAYWSHLRTGLVDILCSLCQQRRNEACVKRYCNNVTVIALV
ncbi:hypothetical protein DPMN_125112 [Dreissena polymorpha]|uniref:Uncharacterized protein n=1 Tax=Dreissena polymorpha TaxID=45954 RepID=A0A9D4GUP5_DREPO|nr:hypothetical protein DPMN_125112 [Dreissena polymorpha]